jgi:hypothetical protein
MSETFYIVKIEYGVYLTDGDGDPPRTLQIENAKKFVNRGDAYIALGKAIKNNPHRTFVTSIVEERNI